jgi:hypothetical protein
MAIVLLADLIGPFLRLVFEQALLLQIMILWFVSSAHEYQRVLDKLICPMAVLK